MIHRVDNLIIYLKENEFILSDIIINETFLASCSRKGGSQGGVKLKRKFFYRKLIFMDITNNVILV